MATFLESNSRYSSEYQPSYNNESEDTNSYYEQQNNHKMNRKNLIKNGNHETFNTISNSKNSTTKTKPS